MSKMKDYKTFLTEKVLKYFPDISWELAEQIVDILVINKSHFIKKWTDEYLKGES